MADQSTTARNARLNALSAAVNTWSQQQVAAINLQVSVAQAILQGRTGSAQLAQSSVQAASALVVNSINDFLTSS